MHHSCIRPRSASACDSTPPDRAPARFRTPKAPHAPPRPDNHPSAAAWESGSLTHPSVAWQGQSRTAASPPQPSPASPLAIPRVASGRSTTLQLGSPRVARQSRRHSRPPRPWSPALRFSPAYPIHPSERPAPPCSPRPMPHPRASIHFQFFAQHDAGTDPPVRVHGRQRHRVGIGLHFPGRGLGKPTPKYLHRAGRQSVWKVVISSNCI
jgi:hypothetical protein